MKILSHSTPFVSFNCGDMEVVYSLNPNSHKVELRMWPSTKASKVVEPIPFRSGPEIAGLPKRFGEIKTWAGEVSLVQLKLAENPYSGAFSAGISMRNNPTDGGLKFVEQSLESLENGFCIQTLNRSDFGFSVMHTLSYLEGEDAISCETAFTNESENTLHLEMLSSFCLGHLTPFAEDSAPERMKLHRFRSTWSAEGRHEATLFEDLHLEPSWIGHSVQCERFGQVGSMPVRKFFPWAGVEDTETGVFWAAQLAVPGSWQMELMRKDNKASLSGGLADRELGHWVKSIKAGNSFTSPKAYLTTSTGTLDQTCQRLTRMQKSSRSKQPRFDQHLPIQFNEWCQSWGTPDAATIEATSKALQGMAVDVYVIDDGWAERPGNGAQQNGDWKLNRKVFPDGLALIVNQLKEQGMAAGLWFEFEVCNPGSEAWEQTDHLLRRDGRTLQVGGRRFWDFGDPWTFDYLKKRVLDRLRNDGFQYLKVDYNDSIGIGVDHPDSLGEGLRTHLEGVQRFFKLLRTEMPELMIECCSSGGHRLEPSFLEICAVGSSTDAHEPREIPIIAANLHRLILPEQSLLWAVLHEWDDARRLVYSMAATFMGRMCLSGPMAKLSTDQLAIVKQATLAYREVVPVIRDGESRIIRDIGKSWRQPKGWQCVIRENKQGDALLVVHAFGNPEMVKVDLPQPTSGKPWQPLLLDPDLEEVSDSKTITLEPWSAAVFRV